MSEPRELSPTQLRRVQRRRAEAAGGGSLADERSQLIVDQRRTRPTERHDHGASREAAGASQAPRRDRAAITWLAQPIALGPGCRIVGYDRALVPGWLAEHIGAIETPNAAKGKA